MATLDHPTLGKIQGIEADGVKKYLGVKYATLDHRFALAQPVKGATGSGVTDATKIGPSTPQWPIGIDIEFGLLQQSLEKPPFEYSDTEGLNANVIVPAAAKPGDHLPVLFWIHGGGYLHGSTAWPQWDLTRLVALSQELGMPIVGVAINYRLRVPGFLTSKELTAAGILPNRGLRDMVAGLEWAKQHIAGFGGDPDNISVMGQSIGAASCGFLLHNREPLFKRLIALGGSSLGIGPLPPVVPDMVAYPAVLGILGLSDLSAEERVDRLKSLPIDEIVQKVPPDLPIMGVIDNEVIPLTLTFANLSSTFPKDHWCKEIFVGDCALDASIFGELALEKKRKGIGKAFATSLKQTLKDKPAVVEALLKAYGINEDSPNDDADFIAICKFANDIAFDATQAAWAREWSGHSGAYRYYFNEGNPWPGKWKGYSTHIMDAVFLFQTFNEKLDARQKEMAKKMATDVISFVNGKGVKPDFDKNQVPCVVYGKNAESDTDPETGRRNLVLPMLQQKQVTADELLGAWNAFMVS